MSDYTIRLAEAHEYPAIATFLHYNWRRNHIFTKSKKLFDWQHWNGKQYNFVLGVHSISGAIHGVFGFIPTGQFDPALGTKHIWLAIWKVCDEAKGQGLGRKLLDFIEETYKPEMIATIGASEMTLPMYRARGYETGRMEHWYMLRNSACDGASDERLLWQEHVPTKSKTYCINRYLNHPFYSYQRAADGASEIVYRVCESESVRGVRIVDVINAPGLLSTIDWREIAVDYGATWIDLYCAGIPSSYLMRAGFTRRIGNEILIPNYFEPYEAHNVEIDYAIKVKPGTFWRMVKGDSDMDRPNVLP